MRPIVFAIVVVFRLVLKRLLLRSCLSFLMFWAGCWDYMFNWHILQFGLGRGAIRCAARGPANALQQPLPNISIATWTIKTKRSVELMLLHCTGFFLLVFWQNLKMRTCGSNVFGETSLKKPILGDICMHAVYYIISSPLPLRCSRRSLKRNLVQSHDPHVLLEHQRDREGERKG
jgi:hypothetical protein